MTYQPNPKAQIGKIYSCITDEWESFKIIIDRVLTTYPEVNKSGIATHLKFLADKNLLRRKEIDGLFHYALANEETKQIESSLPLRILEYCQKHIGKEITTSEINKTYSLPNNSGRTSTILMRLVNQGVLKFISRGVYFVSPEIAHIEKVSWTKPKQELLPAPKSNGKDISQMNIGEIVSDYANVKSENERLKNALKRIAMELMDIIELEQ